MQHACDLPPWLSGIPFLTGVTMNCATTLKVCGQINGEFGRIPIQ
jgi:hypothetical protein